jgi:hypothetical protein
MIATSSVPHRVRPRWMIGRSLSATQRLRRIINETTLGNHIHAIAI